MYYNGRQVSCISVSYTHLDVYKRQDEYLAAKKKEFDGYVPEEVKLLDDAQRSVRGNYVFLAIAPKAQEYKEAFNKSL